MASGQQRSFHVRGLPGTNHPTVVKTALWEDTTVFSRVESQLLRDRTSTNHELTLVQDRSNIISGFIETIMGAAILYIER